MVEGKMSMPRMDATGFRHGSYPVQFVYKHPQTPGVHLAFLADDTYLYATDRKEGYVLRKL